MGQYLSNLLPRPKKRKVPDSDVEEQPRPKSSRPSTFGMDNHSDVEQQPRPKSSRPSTSGMDNHSDVEEQPQPKSSRPSTSGINNLPITTDFDFPISEVGTDKPFITTGSNSGDIEDDANKPIPIFSDLDRIIDEECRPNPTYADLSHIIDEEHRPVPTYTQLLEQDRRESTLGEGADLTYKEDHTMGPDPCYSGLSHIIDEEHRPFPTYTRLLEQDRRESTSGEGAIRKKMNEDEGKIESIMKSLKKPLDQVPVTPGILELSYQKPEMIRKKIVELFLKVSSSLEARNGFAYPLMRNELTSFDATLQYHVVTSKTEANPRMEALKYQLPSTRKTFLLMYLLPILHEQSYVDPPTMTPRTIHYQNELLFENVEVVSQLLDDLCVYFKCMPDSLHVVTGGKAGQVAGQLMFEVGDQDRVNCGDLRSYTIPSYLTGLRIATSDANFILVVEKDTVFKDISSSDFCRTYKCILIAASGQPEINTRKFIHACRMAIKIPVFYLGDSEPFGMNIMSVYKHGSENKAYLSNHFVVPDLKWLGVLDRDLQNYTMSPSYQQVELDLKKCEDIEKKGWCVGDFKEELNLMKQRKKKIQVEAFSYGNHLTTVYLPRKLLGRDWIE